MADDHMAQHGQSASPPAGGGSLRISSGDVEEVFQKKMGQMHLKQKETETERYAAEVGYPHIDLEKFPVSQQALRQMTKEQVKTLNAICFFATQDEVRVGALDPTAQPVQDLLFQLQESNHANGALYAISQKSLSRMLKLYDTLPVVKAITKDVHINEDDLSKVQADVTDFRALQGLLQEKSTTDTFTFLLGAALKLKASDMHVEAEEKGIVVRLRLDGILHDTATLPIESYKKLVSRIKLVSSLKININTTPQDGRFTIKLSDGDVDVRVSTIPTVFGESIVMRLLRQSVGGIALEDIGVIGDAFEKLKHEIERPNGMIITTGPTGSGKTTTMYAVLKLLNKPGVKIITLEDPVEYRMEGINQSQIDRSKDYTFGKALRSVLRQDPDIAMVGEIRDLETADIAIQAALTGHLILSTIHTNSASGAIPRFLSMGVKPFLLAPALNCVIGQRLVRKLCPNCKREITLEGDMLKRADVALSALSDKEKQRIAGKPRVFFTGGGCDACNGIGYKGRIGIYEIFTMTPAIEQLILGGQVSEYEIEKIAVSEGMVTMVQDGILKALAGITSVDEVFRVIE
jgi:type II secretory ATPase GspE/PulE/Tfp pilus assembly ATPase PilB-like protein